MDWLVQRKFFALAISLVLLLIVAPLLNPLYDGRILLDILLGLVFLTSLLVVSTERHMRLAAFLLGIPTMIGLLTGFVIPGMPRQQPAIAFHLLAFFFFAFTVFSILRNLHTSETVSADSIYGSFCGYLLLGVGFSHLYSILDLAAPGSFRGDCLTPNHLPGSRDNYFILTYFSFVTLTTVGYGDLVPATDAARSLSAVEAVTGQFYIAVLVAELIGKRVSQAIISKRDDAAE